MPLCELSCIVLSARISPAGTLMAPSDKYHLHLQLQLLRFNLFLFFFFALISKLPLIPSVPYLATLGPARALMETRCGTSLPTRRCILWSIRWRGNTTQKQHSEADALTCTRPMLTGSKKSGKSRFVLLSVNLRCFSSSSRREHALWPGISDIASVPFTTEILK